MLREQDIDTFACWRRTGEEQANNGYAFMRSGLKVSLYLQASVQIRGDDAQ